MSENQNVLSGEVVEWDVEKSSFTKLPDELFIKMGEDLAYEIRPVDATGEIIIGLESSISFRSDTEISFEDSMKMSPVTFDAEKKAYVCVGQALISGDIFFYITINGKDFLSREDIVAELPYYEYFVEFGTEPQNNDILVGADSYITLSLKDENGALLVGWEDRLSLFYSPTNDLPFENDPLGIIGLNPTYDQDGFYKFKLNTETASNGKFEIQPRILKHDIEQWITVSVSEPLIVYDKEKTTFELLPTDNLIEGSIFNIKALIKDKDGNMVDVENLFPRYINDGMGEIPNPDFKPLVAAVFWFDENKQPVPGSWGEGQLTHRLSFINNGKYSHYISVGGISTGSLNPERPIGDSDGGTNGLPEKGFFSIGVGMSEDSWSPISMADIHTELKPYNIKLIEEKGGVFSDVKTLIEYRNSLTINLMDEEENPITGKKDLFSFKDLKTGNPSHINGFNVDEVYDGLYSVDLMDLPVGLDETVVFICDGKESQPFVHLKGPEEVDPSAITLEIESTTTQLLVGRPFTHYIRAYIGDGSNYNNDINIKDLDLKIEVVSEEGGVTLGDIFENEVTGLATKPTEWHYVCSVKGIEIETTKQVHKASYFPDDIYKVNKQLSTFITDAKKTPSPFSLTAKIIGEDGVPLNIDPKDLFLYNVSENLFYNLMSEPFVTQPNLDESVVGEEFVTKHKPEEGLYVWALETNNESLYYGGFIVGVKTPSGFIDFLLPRIQVIQHGSLLDEVDIHKDLTITHDHMNSKYHPLNSSLNLLVEMVPRKDKTPILIRAKELGFEHSVMDEIEKSLLNTVQLINFKDQSLNFLNLYEFMFSFNSYNRGTWRFNYKGDFLREEVIHLGVMVNGEVSDVNLIIDVKGNNSAPQDYNVSKTNSKMEVKP